MPFLTAKTATKDDKTTTRDNAAIIGNSGTLAVGDIVGDDDGIEDVAGEDELWVASTVPFRSDTWVIVQAAEPSLLSWILYCVYV